MTESERKAMEWLDGMLFGAWSVEGRRHYDALKAALARPALPEEPTGEALRCLYGTGKESMTNVEMNSVVLNQRYRALYAFLAKPVDQLEEIRRFGT